jgi:hypothetical protein
MRTLKLLASLSIAAIAIAIPAGSSAGGPVDPNLNDIVLGTVGGFRYATDTAPYDQSFNGYASVSAGCGSGSWHLIGGGVVADGSPAHAWQSFEYPIDWTDPDTNRDDGFMGTGFGPAGSSIRAYSICAQSYQLAYPFVAIPHQPSGIRSGSAMCPSGYRLTSGGVAISSNKSWITTSVPIDGADSDTIRDDGWHGTGFDTAGGTAGFTVTAVCVQGATPHYVNAAPVSVLDGHAVTVNVSCASNQHVVGGGVTVTGSAAEARIVVSGPFDGSDADSVPDDGWRTTVYNIAASPKTVRSFAICMG